MRGKCSSCHIMTLLRDFRDRETARKVALVKLEHERQGEIAAQIMRRRLFVAFYITFI
jgi:hypothetical protein